MVINFSSWEQRKKKKGGDGGGKLALYTRKKGIAKIRERRRQPDVYLGKRLKKSLRLTITFTSQLGRWGLLLNT